MDRYDRQRRVGTIGRAADERLAALRVLLVGAGGTGSPLAIGLVRAGVGTLTIVDPDLVSESDLARQPLSFPEDAAVAVPKAEAAARELARIGGRSRVTTRSIALSPRNAPELVSSADLVVDATDQLPARAWIDAACTERGIPWIHTAAIRDEYVVIPFIPAGRPCFRCWVPELPAPDAIGTCESDGVLPAATALAAAHAHSAIWGWLRDELPARVGERLVLRGRVGAAAPHASVLRADPHCPGCGERGEVGGTPVVRILCGARRAEAWSKLAPRELGKRLGGSSEEPGATPTVPWRIAEEGGVIRAESAGESLTLTGDGRIIYGPADDPDTARRRLRELLGADALW